MFCLQDIESDEASVALSTLPECMPNDDCFERADNRELDDYAMSGLRSSSVAAVCTSDPEQAPLIASRSRDGDSNTVSGNLHVKSSSKERWIAYFCFLVLGVR